MRFILVGFLIIIGWAASLFGQVRGEVESVGFSNEYRPNCWTPMVIRLTPETGANATYQIRVVQEDVDRDHAIYARTISVTGNAEGSGAREQRFWMYFIPQATYDPPYRGLPDPSDGKDRLNQKLKVFLCNAEGEQLAQLPVADTITKIDGYRGYTRGPGTRLVLLVSDPETPSQPLVLEYREALGVQEHVRFVMVRPGDLPDNVIGYEAVDAVVLLQVDPSNLRNPTDERMRAIREYVRTGGRLVMCQLPDWQRMIGYGDLLPVGFPRYGEGEPSVQGAVQTTDVSALRALAGGTDDPAWDRVTSPVHVGLAEAKGDALVDAWVRWDEQGLPAQTPLVARKVYGLGSVTWVAQDLGAPQLVGRVRSGWTNVWDRVFDWKNDTIPLSPNVSERLQKTYEPMEPFDLGYSVLSGMEHGARGAALVFLAVAFFVIYWIAVGPVAYLVLLQRKRTELSWFVFGAGAIVATLLTVGVVRLVLRGPPEVRHVSVVRQAPGVPAVVDSHLGVYIPRSATQHLQLGVPARDFVSYLTPFAAHPNYAGEENAYPARLPYVVPVPDASDLEAPELYVPYRSTLKKFDAHWVGETTTAGIEGSVRRVPPNRGYLDGTLTNATGHALREVYVAFRHGGTDWALYFPAWDKGGTLNLADEFRRAAFVNPDRNDVPGQGRVLRGRIGRPGASQEWDEWWFAPFRRLTTGALAYNDFDARTPRWFVMSSLFERLPVARVDEAKKVGRFDLLRLGTRHLDASDAMAAGALVVLAQADDTPLPFPFMVEGSPAQGVGKTLYQAVLPLPGSGAEAPAGDEQEQATMGN